MNILNGGAHADNSVDLQEFMIVPYGATKFSEALRMGVEVFHTLKGVLKKRGYSTAVGDEGGFAPNLKSNEEALEVVLEAITKAGYKPGEQIGIALDPGGQRVLRQDSRSTSSRNPTRASARQRADGRVLGRLGRQYPIVSHRRRHGGRRLGRLEAADRHARREDPTGRRRSVRHQHRAPARKASKRASANSILIKVNQIGSLTETLEAMQMAPRPATRRSFRTAPGETEDAVHRRPRGGHERRPDQDRLGQPHGSHREVQPAAAHRRRAGRGREVRRPEGLPINNAAAQRNR